MKRVVVETFCCLVLVILCGCGKNSGGGIPPVTVRTAVPQEATFQDMLETQGLTEAVDQAVLSAMTAGKLESLSVKEGDRVTKGQVLFRSDRQNLENRCRLAEEMLKMAEARVKTHASDVALAQVSYDKAKTDRERNIRLYSTKAVSSDANEKTELAYQKAQLTIEQAQASLATANAEVSFARATLEIARKHLADSTVTAPYDGVITAKLKNENEYCNAGTPVLKIEQPDRKRIVVVLSGLHFDRVKTGETQIAVLHGGKELCRVPVSIQSRTIDPISRTFEVKGDLPVGMAIPSGMLYDVQVITAERRSLAVPEEAVLFRQNGRFTVFFVTEGTAHELPVQPGVSRNGLTELLNRPDVEGRAIVVSGQYFIQENSPVKVAGKQE